MNREYLPARVLVLVLMLTLAPAASLQANNTYFLPGDSFFFLRLSSQDMVRLHPQSTFTWGYSSPREGGYFCGYAGYSRIQLTMPAAMRRSLGRAIKELSPLAPPDESDKRRRVGIFVYNDDFDIHQRRLAVQYNENWVRETAMFGHREDHMRLEDFVGTVDAVTEGWRDGPRVKPLQAKLKPPPDGFGGAFRDPVVPTGDIQLIVIPDRDYAKYFERKSEARLIRVDRDGLSYFRGAGSRWKQTAKLLSPDPPESP